MRKAMLLAMVAAVVGLFATSGTASADWTKHHKAITQTETIEMTTTDFLFKGESGGVTCHSLISVVHFEAGTTGKITTFEPEPGTKCTALAPLAHCTVTEVKADGLPWTIHTLSADKIQATTGTLTFKLTGFLCPSPDFTPGSVTLDVTPGETTTTSTLHMHGELNADNPPQKVTVGATVHLLGPLTYGI